MINKFFIDKDGPLGSRFFTEENQPDTDKRDPFITIETGYYTQLLFAVFNIKLRFMPHMKVIYTEHG
ncbi:hypothetical protein C1G87_1123 [Dehalococcoides mccartyi]|uniref:Uncharacterized protein n=1 Tax=Dehalococcoides mccartyi TaxID=61435 RepID=A0A328EKF2_9CHLR|nr:hypothetical protein C1G87_1123 [Dehalococcoides mccartyi]